MTDVALATIGKKHSFGNAALHLEITRKCPLACSHCYNESGITQPHSLVDWFSVIRQAAGIFRGVQFIGGEPLIHPQVYDLVEFALNQGLEVEIYSNLAVPVKFNRLDADKVKFATSFYSTDAQTHNAITGGEGSFDRTVANIRTVIEKGFNLRVGVVKFPNEEMAETISAFLIDLGMNKKKIRFDHVREIGRADTGAACDPNDKLCSRCGYSAAVLANGQMTSCPMARHLDYGNILQASLAETLYSEAAGQARELLFERNKRICDPQNGCNPENDIPKGSCEPACDPDYSCDPYAGGGDDDDGGDRNCDPECGPD